MEPFGEGKGSQAQYTATELGLACLGLGGIFRRDSTLNEPHTAPCALGREEPHVATKQTGRTNWR